MDYPGEKLLIRMWETLAEKGIGGLLKPWQIRREGQALADVRRGELLLLAQAERDSEDIKLGRKILGAEGRLLPAPKDVDDAPPEGEPLLQLVAKTVERNVTGDAIRKEINVGKTILMAEELLETEAQAPPDQGPDSDWLYRWRDAAGGVSEPELQILWASLLAGEFKAPGTYSLRTVEFVRNLSRNEAEDIARAAPFAAEGIIYSGATQLFEREGLDFGFLLRMQNLGILSGVGGLGLTFTVASNQADGFSAVLKSHGKALLVKKDDAGAKITIGAYPLTELGKEVLRLAHFEAHPEYLTTLGEFLVKQGFTVTLGDFVRQNNNMIRLNNHKGISLPKESTGDDSERAPDGA